jgi:hypothetical protein
VDGGGAEYNYATSNIFASGEVYTPLILQNLLCQFYYSPWMLDCLRQLCNGKTAIRQEKISVFIKNPSGKNYGDLVKLMLEDHNVICVGLYAYGSSEASTLMPGDATNPYGATIICPPLTTKLDSSEFEDVMFIPEGAATVNKKNRFNFSKATIQRQASHGTLDGAAARLQKVYRQYKIKIQAQATLKEKISLGPTMVKNPLAREDLAH